MAVSANRIMLQRIYDVHPPYKTNTFMVDRFGHEVSVKLVWMVLYG